MGLDMYLYAEKYVHNRDYTTEDKDEAVYKAILTASNMDTLPSPDFGGVTISKCIGYWRKANAIHGWFVRELADGVDECQRISVAREDLINLRNDCVNALAKRNEAVETTALNTHVINSTGDNEDDVVRSIMKSMQEESSKSSKTILASDDPLEPTEGFFFGNTDKDDWYYSQLEYTVEMINSMLANDSDLEYEYYYRASW